MSTLPDSLLLFSAALTVCVCLSVVLFLITTRKHRYLRQEIQDSLHRLDEKIEKLSSLMESSVRYAPSQPRGISHDVRDELSALESDVRKLMHSVQSMEAIDTLSKFELRMGKLIGEVESLLGASSHPPEANSVPTSGSASLTPGDPPKTDEDILAHFFDDDETIGASLGKQPDSNVPPVDDKSPLGMVPPGPHESPIEVNLE